MQARREGTARTVADSPPVVLSPLEPVPPDDIHRAMDRDRNREHRHLDVQRGIGLADDEPQRRPVYGFAGSSGDQPADVLVRFAGRRAR